MKHPDPNRFTRPAQDAFERERIHGPLQPMEEPLDLALEWRRAWIGIAILGTILTAACTMEWWLA